MPVYKDKQRNKWYVNYYYTNDWFVFGGIYPLSMTTVTNIKNKTCEIAGVKQIRIHDFRHSCASLFINLGCQPNVIQKYLGHASLKLTLDTYSHLYPSAMDEALNALDSFKGKK